MESLEEKVEQFRASIERLAAKYFPDAFVEVVNPRYYRINLRIKVNPKYIIDIYFNSENDRKDYSLIKDEQRILGYDNFLNWHYHPLHNPTKHIKCKEPSIEKVFRKFKQTI